MMLDQLLLWPKPRSLHYSRLEMFCYYLLQQCCGQTKQQIVEDHLQQTSITYHIIRYWVSKFRSSNNRHPRIQTIELSFCCMQPMYSTNSYIIELNHDAHNNIEKALTLVEFSPTWKHLLKHVQTIFLNLECSDRPCWTLFYFASVTLFTLHVYDVYSLPSLCQRTWFSGRKMLEKWKMRNRGLLQCHKHVPGQNHILLLYHHHMCLDFGQWTYLCILYKWNPLIIYVYASVVLSVYHVLLLRIVMSYVQ